MGLLQVGCGKQPPEIVNVVIEIPMHACGVKYEVDKETGTLHVDRLMSTAMHYPANYGYIPGTLSEDGDPVDVLVITPMPLLSGSVIACRPIGKLRMTDESGVDAKIIAVPIAKLTRQYDAIASVNDLLPELRAQIAHFFEHYKDLEAEKWVKVDGWEGVSGAHAEIMASIQRVSEK